MKSFEPEVQCWDDLYLLNDESQILDQILISFGFDPISAIKGIVVSREQVYIRSKYYGLKFSPELIQINTTRVQDITYIGAYMPLLDTLCSYSKKINL